MKIPLAKRWFAPLTAALLFIVVVKVIKPPQAWVDIGALCVLGAFVWAGWPGLTKLTRIEWVAVSLVGLLLALLVFVIKPPEVWVLISMAVGWGGLAVWRRSRGRE